MTEKTDEMAHPLTIEAPLDPQAMRIVRAVPAVAVAHAPVPRLRVDGKALNLTVEQKRRVGAAEAWNVVRTLEQDAKRPAALVVADRTTAVARRILADHGVGYVDGHGNAHLVYPGVYVHIETPRKQAEPRVVGELRLAGKAGIAAQALLLEPQREWRVTDLAERAAVSVGLAHAVLDRLERLKIVEAQGGQRARARTIADPAALLDLWTEENRDRGVRRLGAYLLPRRGADVVQGAEHALRARDVDHALTGVVAAALLAPFVTTLPAATFWVDAGFPGDELLNRLGAESADRGANLVLMQADDNLPLAFADERDGTRFANVFRIYLDALADPKRGREQAEHLRREVIGW